MKDMVNKYKSCWWESIGRWFMVVLRIVVFLVIVSYWEVSKLVVFL